MKTDERLERVERMLAELLARGSGIDPNRAYSDAEVCGLLGGISATTLWRIRRKGLMESVYLFDDDRGVGRVQRTTGRQLIAYMSGRERKSDVLSFTGTGRERRRA